MKRVAFLVTAKKHNHVGSRVVVVEKTSTARKAASAAKALALKEAVAADLLTTDEGWRALKVRRLPVLDGWASTQQEGVFRPEECPSFNWHPVSGELTVGRSAWLNVVDEHGVSHVIPARVIVAGPESTLPAGRLVVTHWSPEANKPITL
jgi:hypothetical protein